MTYNNKQDLQRLVDYTFTQEGDTQSKLLTLKRMFKEFKFTNKDMRVAATFIASWTRKSDNEIRRILVN